MREIHLVRHGQASARARNYDVLSELGKRQARRLGEHIARAGQAFDVVYSGPRRRQLDTALHIVEAARASGASLPDPIELPGLDEIALGPILALYLPRVYATDQVARAIAERRWEHSDAEIRRVLLEAMESWAIGEVATPSLMSFAQFIDRVGGVLRALEGQRSLLVTSAGPVAAALHLSSHAGALTPRGAMAVLVAVPNGSVTRLIDDAGNFRVAAELDVAHLPSDERTFM